MEGRQCTDRRGEAAWLVRGSLPTRLTFATATTSRFAGLLTSEARVAPNGATGEIRHSIVILISGARRAAPRWRALLQEP